MESTRFALPLLQPGQAQKEMTHNEALAAVDALLHPSVEAVGVNMPTTSPVAGQAWVVGEAPGGAWLGRAGALATWTAGGWRFAEPVEGMAVYCRAGGMDARFHEGGWEVGRSRVERVVIGGIGVVAAQQPAIDPAAGGSVIDVEARAVLGSVLDALKAHGLIAG